MSAAHRRGGARLLLLGLAFASLAACGRQAQFDRNQRAIDASVADNGATPAP